MIKSVKIEITVDVICDVIPERPSRDYYTPPEDASVEIQQVLLGGIDITKALEQTDFEWDIIERQILDEL